jgi:DNA-binding beta-propeller fold protein YncE
MKQGYATMLALLLCSFSLSAQTLFVVNSQSRILSRIDLTDNTVDNNFAGLGNIPNKVFVTEENLWVVNSGDNSVQQISTQSGETIANHFVATGSNPWDCVLEENYLYVSGLISSKVYKMDASTGEVLAWVEVGNSPGAMRVHRNKLYVCNAGSYLTNYSGSSVSVIDLDTFSVIQTIEVEANPQYIVEYNGLLHVSCTGNWADVTGRICILDPVEDTLNDVIDLGGSPGNIWINEQGIAYVGDAGGFSLYSYNADDFSLINPASEPLPHAASDLTGNSSMIALLDPQWGDNAVVNILHPDLSDWKSFTVRLMPTDIKLLATTTGSTDEINTPQAITSYPNPAESGAKIRFSASVETDGELAIYNLRGQKVQSQTMRKGSAEILLPRLPSALYFYRLQSAKGSLTGKFIVK